MKIAGMPTVQRWRRRARQRGEVREEALKHIDEVTQLVVESMIEHGQPLPEESTKEVQLMVEPRVTVNL